MEKKGQDIIMNKNDERILELKKKIDEKRLELGSSKFIPVTNCNLIIGTERYNLHATQEDKLKELLIDFHVKNNAVKELELSYELCGYTLDEWIMDIKRRLVILNKAGEERKLKAMEDKLNVLLSEDKKVELELSNIENML